MQVSIFLDLCKKPYYRQRGEEQVNLGSLSDSATVTDFTAVLICLLLKHPSTQAYSHYIKFSPRNFDSIPQLLKKHHLCIPHQ